MTTTVTPVSLTTLTGGAKWVPVQREQATGVAIRSGLDDKARNGLIQSAAEILGSGVDPSGKKGSATGLVVGYVQSGKTMSFTTVIGLARDNGFPLVILVAGNKDNLLTQSHERLARDLNTEGGDGLPVWKMRKNIRASEAHEEQFIRQSIESWRDPTLDDDERATVLLTVLKQNQRLQSLTTLLSKLDMREVPVLIVDDEADQASLNTKTRQGEESTTYTRLRELREALPRHTYLQYTATPQAPLLINIADTLSPDFVHVLQPGAGYVGGKEFFARNSKFVKVIPETDMAPGGGLLNDPPASLLEALRVFFVGLTISLLTSKARRSMLIHPSRIRSDHREVAQWAAETKNNWLTTLKLASKDPDRDELEEDFRSAYEELAKTDKNLPKFDTVVDKLPRALRNTMIVEFNTNGRPKTPEIKWRDAEGWILVGGQAVDRGFTVDSLTVTYMPRGVGMGNADALQQRARFFGYKRKYLGICRIYLEQQTRAAFEDYVEHEDIMHRELVRLVEKGESLRTWRRRLILSPELHPCRRSVVSDDYVRASKNGGWTQQRGAEMSLRTRNVNALLLSNFLKHIKFQADNTYASTEDAQIHSVAHGISLSKVVDMLSEYRLEDARDTAAFTGVLVALGEAVLAKKDATASVYRMRPQAKSGRRTVSQEGNLDDGFQQGRTALADGGTAYPGDAFFRAANEISIQLHSYDLMRDKKLVATAAPLLALHVPPRLAKAWLVQLQSGQPFVA